MTNETFERILNDAKAYLESQEQLLSFLREQGLSKIKSVIALVQLMQIKPDEAKEIVHFSKTWTNQKDADESVIQSAMDEVERLSGTSRVNIQIGNPSKVLVKD